jgi:hypothetical protein
VKWIEFGLKEEKQQKTTKKKQTWHLTIVILQLPPHQVHEKCFRDRPTVSRETPRPHRRRWLVSLKVFFCLWFLRGRGKGNFISSTKFDENDSLGGKWKKDFQKNSIDLKKVFEIKFRIFQGSYSKFYQNFKTLKR